MPGCESQPPFLWLRIHDMIITFLDATFQLQFFQELRHLKRMQSQPKDKLYSI